MPLLVNMKQSRNGFHLLNFMTEYTNKQTNMSNAVIDIVEFIDIPIWSFEC